MKKPENIYPNIPTYANDGRRSLLELGEIFSTLRSSGWKIKTVATQKTCFNNHYVDIPIIQARTPNRPRKPSLIGLYTVHGEEPEGTNAVASQIEEGFIQDLGKDYNLVLYLLTNPEGYIENKRYQRIPGHENLRRSVTDSTHLLIKVQPASQVTADVTRSVVEACTEYDFIVGADHHADKSATIPYWYYYGNNMKFAGAVTKILKDNGMSFQNTGTTRFGEKIISGFVQNSKDNSVDHYLWERHGLDVAVIETPVNSHPLSARQKAHEKIIEFYPGLIEMKVKEQRKNRRLHV